MKVNALTVFNIRNIKNAKFKPSENLTVIAGKNGQGKTNLLECIWLLTGSKSFRGSKDKEIIKEDENAGKIVGEAQTNEKNNKIEINVFGKTENKKGRFAKINDVDYGRASNAAGILTAVVFHPGHLSLVKGGPDGRRKFVDAALCQIYPSYLAIIRRFQRALTQKNALLKKHLNNYETNILLDAFDEEICVYGQEITNKRKEYLDIVGIEAENYYKEISNNSEQMSLKFKPCTTEEKSLKEVLKEARSFDLRIGFSTKGPQREDFKISLNNKNSKDFASQGQQRSIALSLKLAEANFIYKKTNEHPIMLLDDVLSELDETRQSYLLNNMQGKQSFVTTCDELIFKKTNGKIIKVENGEII